MTTLVFQIELFIYELFIAVFYSQPVSLSIGVSITKKMDRLREAGEAKGINFPVAIKDVPKMAEPVGK